MCAVLCRSRRRICESGCPIPPTSLSYWKVSLTPHASIWRQSSAGPRKSLKSLQKNYAGVPYLLHITLLYICIYDSILTHKSNKTKYMTDRCNLNMIVILISMTDTPKVIIQLY